MDLFKVGIIAIREKFTNETNEDCFCKQYQVEGGSFTDEYVYWLEKRLQKAYFLNVCDSVFDAKIEQWHNLDTELKLWEFLGLTEEEYAIWFKDPEKIEKYYK